MFPPLQMDFYVLGFCRRCDTKPQNPGYQILRNKRWVFLAYSIAGFPAKPSFSYELLFHKKLYHQVKSLKI
jgi:hypothetical protein